MNSDLRLTPQPQRRSNRTTWSLPRSRPLPPSSKPTKKAAKQPCRTTILIPTHSGVRRSRRRARSRRMRFSMSNGCVWSLVGLTHFSLLIELIADEAQNIKNRKTNAAKAAVALRARYRWCLTGWVRWPMVNFSSWQYSYSGSWREWQLSTDTDSRTTSKSSSPCSSSSEHVHSTDGSCSTSESSSR